MTVGEMLRGWRQHRGLSQRAAAAQASIPQSTWSHLEAGHWVPRSGKIVRRLLRITRNDPRFALTASMFPGFKPPRPGRQKPEQSAPSAAE